MRRWAIIVWALMRRALNEILRVPGASIPGDVEVIDLQGDPRVGAVAEVLLAARRRKGITADAAGRLASNPLFFANWPISMGWTVTSMPICLSCSLMTSASWV